ncbi:probable galacturonosyltransferase 15 [Musa acuminata AAA Group]|uniref:probable galacturonosyltransferase 15 n=1 Tax=Musa acuminata AAA Group TaxID=214697 RepID=UPI0031DF4343
MLISCDDAENIVFHIITDKKTYTLMHTWFALHSVFPAILEVRGLHQFNSPPDEDVVIMDTVEELHQSSYTYRYYRGVAEEYRRLSALKPSTFSLVNYLRIHLPELFPKLERVIFLDDDVVVQRDLTSLWHLDLHGLVMGAVSSQECNHGLCIGKTFNDYMNVSNPLISSSSLDLQRTQCAWLEGMNIFDLRAWRKNNITRTYQRWLKLACSSRSTIQCSLHSQGAKL